MWYVINNRNKKKSLLLCLTLTLLLLSPIAVTYPLCMFPVLLPAWMLPPHCPWPAFKWGLSWISWRTNRTIWQYFCYGQDPKNRPWPSVTLFAMAKIQRIDHDRQPPFFLLGNFSSVTWGVNKLPYYKYTLDHPDFLRF